MDTKKTRVYTCNVLDGTVGCDQAELSGHPDEDDEHALVNDSAVATKSCVFK